MLPFPPLLQITRNIVKACSTLSPCEMAVFQPLARPHMCWCEPSPAFFRLYASFGHHHFCRTCQSVHIHSVRRLPHLHGNSGRMHSNGKGISASVLPYRRTVPNWLKTTAREVVDQICKMAKKGVTPAQIGVALRDSHGVGSVKAVTGMFVYPCSFIRLPKPQYA